MQHSIAHEIVCHYMIISISLNLWKRAILMSTLYPSRFYYECYFLKVQVMPTNDFQCNLMTFPRDAILYIYLLLQRGRMLYSTHCGLLFHLHPNRNKIHDLFSHLQHFFLVFNKLHDLHYQPAFAWLLNEWHYQCLHRSTAAAT